MMTEFEHLREENYHVLVVEDNPDLNQLYSDRIRKEGYHVSQAANIQQARELLERQSFELLICDIRMGDGLGTDLIMEHLVPLRQQGTQIVVVSAEPQYQHICEQMGIEFFMVKPVAVRMLAHLVNRLLPIRN